MLLVGLGRVLVRFTGSLLLTLVIPISLSAHDGELDTYGCHYESDRKNYHCHQGVFKGGVFESKIEMIRLLKIQFLNLGRPWPYGDLLEEDITSTEPQNDRKIGE
ncbi:MAG TPA: hypothetical protein VFU31_09275 [Candidatus Binatia bacterium]|nr:hypothetical protein [Candidatus Binatia bacterium]